MLNLTSSIIYEKFDSITYGWKGFTETFNLFEDSLDTMIKYSKLEGSFITREVLGEKWPCIKQKTP